MLKKVFDKYDDLTDKSLQTSLKNGHNYIDYYQGLLDGFNKPINLMELGVRYGGSILMWAEYMPQSNIVGVDLDERWEVEFPDNVEIVLHDYTEEGFLDKLPKIKYDIIIDDGSHKVGDQQYAFQKLHPILKKGGVYVIEDIQSVDQFENWFEQYDFHIRDLTYNRNKDSIIAIHRNE